VIPADTALTSKRPARIAGMFDAIAPRYDALNHLLSAGLDRGWRRRAVRALELSGGERVLDICTGTGDLALEAMRGPVGRGALTSPAGRAREVVGVDFAAEMLRLGLVKVREAHLEARVHLVRGDATRIPLPDGSCDAALVGFGIRNVIDPGAACREVARVVRPGGRFAVLEFGSPTVPGLRGLYGWYFRAVLPRIGRLVSKHGDAYSYLPASVAQFPEPDVFMSLMRASGFQSVRYQPLTFGVVSLFVAQR
jgi:demethylmenaquinone methyltransferase/2-methoxy-6-polyprenyl-1,4-benzoquinol methylase